MEYKKESMAAALQPAKYINVPDELIIILISEETGEKKINIHTQTGVYLCGAGGGRGASFLSVSIPLNVFSFSPTAVCVRVCVFFVSTADIFSLFLIILFFLFWLQREK